MDKKTAYCCLNCTASPNCCGACGECPACCEDCGDTSSCRTTAYFGKDNKIYKRYIVNYTISSYYCNGTCPAGGRDSIPPFWYVYETKEGWTGVFDSEYPNEYEISGFDSYKEFNWYCEINIDGYEYEYDNSSTSIQKNYNTRFAQVNTWSQCGPDQSDENGIEPLPPFPSPTKDAKNSECGLPYSTDPNDSIYITSTVTFTDELKTYNNKGELVADPIPEDPYDPCNPIRPVEVGCHFFAP